MLKQLGQIFSRQKKVAGIEVISSSEGKYMFNCVLLSVKNNIAQIELKEKEVDDFEKLKLFIPQDIPLFLTLTGRGILHKNVKDEYSDDTQIFNQIFPNAKLTDYYIQKTAAAANHLYISLTRKQLVDSLLQKFKEQNYFVTSMSLGPFPVADLFQLLSIEVPSLSFGHHELVFNKNQINVYRTKEESNNALIKAGDEMVSGDLLIAYASAFLGIIDSDRVRVSIEQVDVQKEEFQQKRKFKLLSISLLTFFLSILLINTLLLTNYKQENEKLAIKLSKLNDLSSNLEVDEKELQQKELFLTEAGWLVSSKFSFYSDQIAVLLPPSITLTKLAMNPYNQKESRIQRKEVFENGAIRIDGYCVRPTELNSWVKILKDQHWVKEVNVEDYSFDHKTRSGNFILQILINDELE
ncbi:hypothetical protein Solca_1567 [Sporocytophaga myxococcoides]|uniref:Fimbrial assembly family protein n=1 Tax=Sporocytophaga myxococcoides TaxID=153721 RepID=A0A098LGR5_9BACT|nr:hypothetical protein [Sporocytophaga myxococcoides]GAL85652.1 hypothetical protein Solca_1567 [Sporocytophaga myxococcoides]